jgi:hypothetical protein
MSASEMKEIEKLNPKSPAECEEEKQEEQFLKRQPVKEAPNSATTMRQLPDKILRSGNAPPPHRSRSQAIEICPMLLIFFKIIHVSSEPFLASLDCRNSAAILGLERE